MDKIFKKLAEIPHDKLLHSFYGTLIYVLLAWYDVSLAIAVVGVIAITKEVYDEIVYGGFSFMDIVFTVAIPVVLFLKELHG